MFCLEAIVAMNAKDETEARETWRRLREANANANAERSPPAEIQQATAVAAPEAFAQYY